ncbi:TonB-dependent receptor [Halioglobus maricola]|nr:TonB-dependent receptor [Halioglobus maricola]
MHYSRSKLATAITGLVLASVIAPSHAQQLEEVVVTAQKRSESVQDVPIAITALSGEQITKTGAVDFESLSDSLPNVEIAKAPGIKAIGIRGIASGAGNTGFEQSVGLYVDGIYASRVELFQEPFMDIERLEVLKGPQGVLFGKNSIAGALASHSARPTDTFEASISATYEFEYDGYEVTGIVSGPLTDNLFGRLAVRDQSQGAYVDNGSTGPDAGEDESTTIRGSFIWNPSEETEVYLKVETADYEATGYPWETVADDAPGSTAWALDTFGPGTVNGEVLGAVQGIRAAIPIPGVTVADPHPVVDTVPIPGADFSLGGLLGILTSREDQYFGSRAGGDDFVEDGKQFLNANTYTDHSSDNVTLQLTHYMGEFELVYLGGYGQFERESNNDNDFSAVDTLTTFNDRDFDQTSHEIRLVSPQGETIDYIVGAYYLDRTFEIFDSNRLFGSTAQYAETEFYQNFSWGGQGNYKEDAESLAFFAQVTWNITDTLRASFGGRYSEEEKTARNSSEGRTVLGSSELLEDADPVRADYLATNFGSGVYDYSDTINEYAFDPSVVVQWDFNDSSMAYVSWTQATKAGGFDANTGEGDEGNFTFEPEEAESIEIGVKTEFYDGRARLNAAIFFTDFSDLQVSAFDPNAGTVGAFVTTNAAEATTDGVEIDGLFAVSENLTLGGSVAFLEAEYDEYEAACPNSAPAAAALDCFTNSGGALVQDLSGVRLAQAPEWSGNLFADYSIPVGELYLGFRADVIYKDEVNLDYSQDYNLFVDDYWKINLLATLDSADDDWSLALGVFNLEDEQPVTFGGQAFGVDGLYWKNITRGREIKATATYRF